MTNSSLPGIPSYFWLNDHWVKFRLIVNNYQNIISSVYLCSIKNNKQVHLELQIIKQIT